MEATSHLDCRCHSTIRQPCNRRLDAHFSSRSGKTAVEAWTKKNVHAVCLRSGPLSHRRACRVTSRTPISDHSYNRCRSSSASSGNASIAAFLSRPSIPPAHPCSFRCGTISWLVQRKKKGRFKILELVTPCPCGALTLSPSHLPLRILLHCAAWCR